MTRTVVQKIALKAIPIKPGMHADHHLRRRSLFPGAMHRLFCLLLAIIFFLPAAAGADEVQRFLLIGTDIEANPSDGSAEDRMSRADVILILAVKRGQPDIRVLNIERDYLVELPNGVGANKLATATFFGGPELLLDAINQLLDVDIRRYIQTSIENIPAIIDSIGGIDLEVFEEEVEGFGKTNYDEPVLFTGINHLNGVQAQNFIRFRDEDMDAIESSRQRNRRHMRILSAFADRAFSLSLRDTMNAVEQLSSQVMTNITLYDLMLLIQAVSVPGQLMDRLEYMNSPNGHFEIKRVKMHQVVMAENMEEEQRKAKEFLYY